MPLRVAHLTLAASLLALAAACGAETGARPSGFFAAITRYDTGGIRALAAPDFVLLEDGATWNGDSLNRVVAGLQNGGLRIEYAVTENSVRVEEPLAWMTYRNRGILAGERGADTLEWMESALVRHHAGAGRLVLLHSTRVRTDR